MSELLSQRRVLVVEDEMLVLIMIEDMLADLGCTSIATAATVAKALALIESETFDLAMLDMNLKGAKTFAVADALVARDIPFCFSTGYSGTDVRGDYANFPVLKKPYRDGEMAKMLSQLLDR